MALAPGTRLGPYEVVALLGAGGMGEVYRATDTRLNRSVAIKVLSHHYSDDPDMKERFEREAQTIAGLNHPHICTLHDVGHHEGFDYLVMECVEGETLAARLERGAIPIREALTIATQIGDALDKAHRQGVVHRDLKPGNIMLRKSGAKLLDFGLAKLRSAVAPTGPVSVTAMPTNARELTMVGSILGTLQYMAPEQLEGKDADARTDVFAFGATLYEMLTGQKAFQGKSQVSLMASILEHDPPPMASLQPILPPALDDVVRGCLAKDPEERWQTVRDVVRQLKRIADTPDSSQIIQSANPVNRRERWIWAAIAGVLAIVAVIFGARIVLRQEAPTPIVRFDVSPPPGASWSGPVPRFAISPDGENLVFAAGESPEKNRLWIRRLDSPEIRPLAGTESGPGEFDPQQPFWSPDSRSIGFFVTTEAPGGGGNASSAALSSKLKRLDIDTGRIQTLCELPSNQAGATWNTDGVILVSSRETKGIRRISANGGPSPVQVTKIDESRKETAQLWPQFLPDGRHFLYQSQTLDRQNWAIDIGSIDSSDHKRVVEAEYAQFAKPNWLVYPRGSVLLAQKLDLRTLDPIGEPVQIAESLLINTGNGRSAFSVSNAGVLILASASSDAQQAQTGGRQFVWVDRTGKQSDPISSSRPMTNLRLSEDGKYAVFVEQPSPALADISLFDIGRKTIQKLTTDPAADRSPIFVDNGRKIIFASERGEKANGLYEMPFDAATREKLLLAAEPGMTIFPLDWSRNGNWLMYAKRNASQNKRDLWVLSLTGDAQPRSYMTTPFDETQATFSPNGRWVAYASDTDGKYQVFVQSFPNPSLSRKQISGDAGAYPRWKPNGSELYYYDFAKHIVSVSFNPDTGEVGASTQLFETPFEFSVQPQGSVMPYDVYPSGDRFLMAVPANRLVSESPTPLTVTINWNSALK